MATTFKKSPYREADEFNERYMQPIMDQVYGLLGYKTERVEDKERQIRGADVILTNANGQIADTNLLYYGNDSAKEYAKNMVSEYIEKMNMK